MLQNRSDDNEVTTGGGPVNVMSNATLVISLATEVGANVVNDLLQVKKTSAGFFFASSAPGNKYLGSV